RPRQRVAQAAIRGRAATERHCRTRRHGSCCRARDVESDTSGVAGVHRAQAENPECPAMNKEQQLIDDYLDGELSPDEEGRLTEWLAADTEHVRLFVRETH